MLFLISVKTMSSGAAGLMKAVRYATFLAIPSGGTPVMRASDRISVWWIDWRSLNYVLLNKNSELLDVCVPTGVTLEGGGFCGTVL